MSFPDIAPELKAKMPALRGRLLANEPLAPLTWFRVGGPAQVLFMPEDEADLAYFLAHLPAEIPVAVVGLGSNLIVRDGGVPGVVIRLGRGFGDVKVEPPVRLLIGCVASRDSVILSISAAIALASPGAPWNSAWVKMTSSGAPQWR